MTLIVAWVWKWILFAVRDLRFLCYHIPHEHVETTRKYEHGELCPIAG